MVKNAFVNMYRWSNAKNNDLEKNEHIVKTILVKQKDIDKVLETSGLCSRVDDNCCDCCFTNGHFYDYCVLGENSRIRLEQIKHIIFYYNLDLILE